VYFDNNIDVHVPYHSILIFETKYKMNEWTSWCVGFPRNERCLFTYDFSFYSGDCFLLLLPATLFVPLVHGLVYDASVMFFDIIHHLVYFRKTWPPEIGASSIYWTQVSRFYLRTGTESSFRNVVFWKKKQDGFLKNRQDNVWCPKI
jgi:hypothetical protein